MLSMCRKKSAQRRPDERASPSPVFISATASSKICSTSS
jgi:hypothetical protein